MKCRNCGAPIEPEDKFCEKCGTKVELIDPYKDLKFCWSCGQKLKPGARFCPKCGQDVLSQNEQANQTGGKANEQANQTGGKANEQANQTGGNANGQTNLKGANGQIQSVSAHDRNSQVSPENADKNKRLKNKSFKGKAIVLAIILLLVAGIGIGGGWYLSQSGRSTKEAQPTAGDSHLSKSDESEKEEKERNLLTGGELSGDGESSDGKKSQQTVASGNSDPLTVNIWDSNQQAGIQEICDDWTKESGIEVNVEVVDWDNYWTLLEAGASGGTLPDVFWMHSDYSQIYMENDILLDLTDYIKNDDVDTSIYYQDILGMYQSGGKTYALPKDHDTIALIYNKAIFDEAGVEYPTNDWTYEDMYEAAKTITEKTSDDTYGCALNTSNDQDGWYNYVYAYGGNVINTEKTDTAIDSAEGKAGMEMVRKMLTVSAPQEMVAESGTDNLFLSGKVAMITQGSWMINTFYTAENAADYAWVEIPYADVNGDGTCQAEERQTCYNGLGWAAAANTSNADNAAALIEYLCSEEAETKQAELGVTMAAIPGISDAFESAFDGMDVSAFNTVEEDGTLYLRPGTRNSGTWKDPMEQAGGFLDAWQDPTNAETMSTACDNVAKMIRNAIAEGN